MTDWTPLRDEIALWRDRGLVLPFWWRDDDAVEDTQALRRLAGLGARHGLPVHLAVIPEGATAALARRIGAGAGLIPMVHGRAHRNHARPGAKKAEFGADRDAEALARDAGAGLQRLAELFGPQLAPVFVPPWNRIAPDLVPRLPGLGFQGLSTFGPRAAPQAAPGLWQVNTHVDPIDWRGTRGLIAPDILIARIVALLRDRRLGLSDAVEPLGLLTHHLVHDAGIWDFCDALLAELAAIPTDPWSPARQENRP